MYCWVGGTGGGVDWSINHVLIVSGCTTLVILAVVLLVVLLGKRTERGVLRNVDDFVDPKDLGL